MKLLKTLIFQGSQPNIYRLGGGRSIQLSYEDLYKIDDFGSFFELTADMSFPPGGWSAITLGGGRSILLSYVDVSVFWLKHGVFCLSDGNRFMFLS